MLFSSVTFLYYFFPAVIALYYITPMIKGSPKLRNWVLLLASLVFYAWGEPVYVLLMIAQTFSGWFFALLISKTEKVLYRRLFLILALCIGFGSLMFFKYADFFISNYNTLTGAGSKLLHIAMPIGISFYTFQILSYTIDIYLRGCDTQKNFFTFATYLSLFPQLIAGPIVRYVDVARELESRQNTLDEFAFGVKRFVIGLGKKVLIANVLGELVEIYKAGSENTVLFAWVYIVAYSFHIYFDFSGYSDMAIGMGHIFGFKFLENFNYPYIAKSITDFWRRWHMSLSSWFRDYVYIPLGGNRRSPARQVFNIFFVWFLTGFWHGAGWNFITWGVYYGVILLIEKFWLGKLLAKLPDVVSHLYLIFFVMLGWVLFDAPDLPVALSRAGALFGVGTQAALGPETLYYLKSYGLVLIIAAIGSTPIPKIVCAKLEAKNLPAKLLTFLEPAYIAIVLVAVTAYLVDGSFNPFIYFRF